MSRLPIRVRLTLVFALATVAILALGGVLVHQRLRTSLDANIDQSLRARAADVAALVQQADTGLADSRLQGLVHPDGSLEQVLASTGRVVDRTPASPPEPLISRHTLALALRAPRISTHPGPDGVPVRLLAAPVDAQGTRLVVVVGATLEGRNAALSTLRTELFLALPAAMLLLIALGYAVTAGALRPVRSLRAAVEQIGPAPTDTRLPVPRAHDELRDLAQTLNTMLGRIDDAARHEQTFVADASHELRTPIAVIAGELELARRSHRSRQQIDESLAIAEAETHRLAQLAEDLLLLARARAGQLLVSPSDIDVRAALDQTARRFHRRAVAAGRDLIVESDAGLAVRADADRLQQALDNLVDNALRHGGGTITLRGEPCGSSVALSVRDEGPGFPPELAARAHERFARGDSAGATPGAGLGLAITDEIAQAHGGRLEIGSTPSSGAVVTVRFSAVDHRTIAASSTVKPPHDRRRDRARRAADDWHATTVRE